MAYASLTDLKAYLGISVSEESDDALLTDLLSRAEKIIDGRTGRKFEAATETRYFSSDDTDGPYLNLWNADLLTVTKLTNGDGNEITSANYKLLPRNSSPKWLIQLHEDQAWNFDDSDSEITVAGTWGYSATAPADIEHATIRLAAFMYRQKDTSADVDRPLVTGDGVTVMPSALPSDVEKIVRRYEARI